MESNDICGSLLTGFFLSHEVFALGFNWLRKLPSVLLRVFFSGMVGFCQMFLLLLLRWLCGFCLFYSCGILHRFLSSKATLNFWDKSHLVLCMLDLECWYFFKDFSCIYEGYWSVIFLWCWCWGNTVFTEWGGKYSSLLLCGIVYERLVLIFKHLVEFTSEIIWV